MNNRAYELPVRHVAFAAVMSLALGMGPAFAAVTGAGTDDTALSQPAPNGKSIGTAPGNGIAGMKFSQNTTNGGYGGTGTTGTTGNAVGATGGTVGGTAAGTVGTGGTVGNVAAAKPYGGGSGWWGLIGLIGLFGLAGGVRRTRV